MASKSIVSGSARKALVRNTGLNFVGSDGAALGVYDASQYARLCGLFSIVGSATFSIGFGADSSAFQVSSTFVVNSGGSTLDVLNYGNHVNLSFTQATSQAAATVLVYGEPVR